MYHHPNHVPVTRCIVNHSADHAAAKPASRGMSTLGVTLQDSMGPLYPANDLTHYPTDLNSPPTTDAHEADASTAFVPEQAAPPLNNIEPENNFVPHSPTTLVSINVVLEPCRTCDSPQPCKADAEPQIDMTKAHHATARLSTGEVHDDIEPDVGSLLATQLEETWLVGSNEAEGTLLDDEANTTAENSPSIINNIQITEAFIKELHPATLRNGDLPLMLIQTLQDPKHCLTGPLNIDDPILHLALNIFLVVSNALQQTYDDLYTALRRYDPALNILSLDQIKHRVANLSGVVPVLHHMCGIHRTLL